MADDDSPVPQKKTRVRGRKSCDRCHKKKVKCDLKSPCSTCIACGQSEKCNYFKVEKPVYITVRKDHVEGLTRDVMALKKQLAIVTAQILKQPANPERKTVEDNSESAYNPMSLSSILDSRSKTDPDDNPLVADQNIPHSKSYFTYMGDSACSKFNTKLQQYVWNHHNQDHPRSGYVSEQRATKYEDEDLYWNNYNISEGYVLPPEAEAHTLINIAYKYVGVEYYLVMIHSFEKFVSKVYENYVPGRKVSVTPNREVSRSEMAQFFAMCALGSLYSGTLADAKHQVPGSQYFKIAVALLKDDFEEPSINYVEALCQIGYYSYALNRVRSAFVYNGLALRIALSLGLHRRASFWNNPGLDLKGRERRRRLFYTLFIFDRLISAKLGYPVSIDDEDIDTELPSEICFTEAEYKEFPDPKYMLAQIQIATISTLIVKNIYGINQLKKKNNSKNFAHNVHYVLSELKDCYEGLDPTLKLQYYNNQPLNTVLRNIFSFHMHYNQLIILATRPLLLYIFTRAISDADFIPSQITSAIGDACIQSAYSINSLISTLYRTGYISSFGFFDAHYCFSSTIILIISRILTNFDAVSRFEIDTKIADSTNILKNMERLGSIPAKQFSAELDKLHATFKEIEGGEVGKVFTKINSDPDGTNSQQAFHKEDTPISKRHDYVPSSDIQAKGKDNNILQVAGHFALDDEILQDFLSTNFGGSANQTSPESFEDVLNLDDFEEINNILQDFQY